MSLCIHTVQHNFTVGDMPGNAQAIIEAARAAHAQAAPGVAQLVLAPELAISGYIPEDLLLRPDFMAACASALQAVAQATASLPGVTVVAGHPQALPGGQRANAASVLRGGQVAATYAKQALPNYEVFDERRYFTPGQGPCVFDAGGLRVGLLICEDAWQPAPAAQAKAAGAELLAVLNASPFHMGKTRLRQARMAERVRETGLPLVYAHLVGGQDELVFEGASFALNADASLAGCAPAFQQALWPVAVQRQAHGLHLQADSAPAQDDDASLWHALVLGLRDYVRKNGFSTVALGLSGGIDSALVLALAVDALGPDKVRTLMMPSPYTAGISLQDAREMARRLGVRHDEVDIGPAFEAFNTSLAPLFESRAPDTTEENIQARIRGVLLMALSNKLGQLILTTGNKSEYATGYCTLYGDMCGGFAPIKDVLKTRVFALARWRNAHDPYGRGANPIPERIITRPPSAELRENQTDQDSLPPYDVLDALITACLEQHASRAELLAQGFAPDAVDQVMRLIRLSEYKRQQAAPGTRVTQRSFGKDWRYPLTNAFRPDTAAPATA